MVTHRVYAAAREVFVHVKVIASAAVTPACASSSGASLSDGWHVTVPGAFESSCRTFCSRASILSAEVD